MRRVRKSEDDSTAIILVIVFAAGGVLLLFGLMAIVVVVVLVSSSGSSPSSPPPAVDRQMDPPRKSEPKKEKVIPGDVFAFIQQSVTGKNLVDVGPLGFNANNNPYRDVPPEGAILIGFQAGLKPFLGDALVIDSLRPIYLAKNGEKMGQWYGKVPANPITVKAKSGYVVSGVNVNIGLLIDGFSLKFAKLGQGRLNLEDSYESAWVGGKGGGSNQLGGQGAIFVGVCGNLNDQGAPCSLALITLPLFQQ